MNDINKLDHCLEGERGEDEPIGSSLVVSRPFDNQARSSSLFFMKTAAFSIGAFEAKNRFSDLIDRVGRGAEITITKHNKPVAKIVPVADALRENRRRAAAELRALRGRYRLEGVSVRELIDEGRR